MLADLDRQMDLAIARDRSGTVHVPNLDRTSLSVFTVYFDGGDSGQYAYGSWSIWWNGFNKTVRRFKIRDKYPAGGITSNVAEYVSLLEALRWFRSVKEKHRYWVNIWGDSQLVVYQVSGDFKCHKEHLSMLRSQAVGMLNQFGGWSIRWHPRKESLAMFGH